MKRIEKLRKCIKNLIKQNVDNLSSFSVDSFMQPSDPEFPAQASVYETVKANIEDPSSVDGFDSIEVTLEDLFLKLTTDLIAPTKEDIEEELKRTQEANQAKSDVPESQSSKAKGKRKDSQGNNKIILNL